MKILMLTPYLPFPTNSGGQIRSFNLIKQLSKKHQITLFSLIKTDDERKYMVNLEKYCHRVRVFNRPPKPWTINNILKTGSSTYPFVVIRNYSREERKEVARILEDEKFDIIHAETFYVSPHIPKTDVPIVLVDQTIEYQVYQHFVENFKYKALKPLLNIDVLKIKHWETYYWKRSAKVVAVAEKDAKLMKKLVPNLNVEVIPNGVGDDLIDGVPLHYCKNILFQGNYAWLQNIEAARILAKQVFPLVLKKVPDAKLVISGQYADKIVDLNSDQVKVLDTAIDDIESVKKNFRENGIIVAPLYGPGGTRLKILGAMAAKLPVVTTKIGIEGIDAVNGESALFGETPTELADLAVKLLEDKDLYKKIALNARKLIEEKYTYEAIADQLDKLYREVVNEA